MGWIMSNKMPKIGLILTGALAFLTMMLYVSLLTYLTLKREKSTASPTDLAMGTIRTSGSRDERGSDLSSN
jgi:hypothetical protein